MIIIFTILTKSIWILSMLTKSIFKACALVITNLIKDQIMIKIIDNKGKHIFRVDKNKKKEDDEDLGD